MPVILRPRPPECWMGFQARITTTPAIVPPLNEQLSAPLQSYVDFNVTGNRNRTKWRAHRALDLCGGKGPRREASDPRDHRGGGRDELHEEDGRPVGHRPEETEVQSWWAREACLWLLKDEITMVGPGFVGFNIIFINYLILMMYKLLILVWLSMIFEFMCSGCMGQVSPCFCFVLFLALFWSGVKSKNWLLQRCWPKSLLLFIIFKTLKDLFYILNYE